MKTIILILMVSILGNTLFTVSVTRKDRDKSKEITELKKIIQFQMVNIKEKNKVIDAHYNDVKRMQIIMGVDTIDNVFTYQDKLLNNLNTNEALKKDLRVKK